MPWHYWWAVLIDDLPCRELLSWVCSKESYGLFWHVQSSSELESWQCDVMGVQGWPRPWLAVNPQSAGWAVDTALSLLPLYGLPLAALPSSLGSALRAWGSAGHWPGGREPHAAGLPRWRLFLHGLATRQVETFPSLSGLVLSSWPGAHAWVIMARR